MKHAHWWYSSPTCEHKQTCEQIKVMYQVSFILGEWVDDEILLTKCKVLYGLETIFL